jgi:hypothetical protein
MMIVANRIRMKPTPRPPSRMPSASKLGSSRRGFCQAAKPSK